MSWNRAGLVGQILLCATVLLPLSSTMAQAEQLKPSAATAIARAALPKGSARDFGPAPSVPNGPLPTKVKAALRTVFSNVHNVSLGDREARAFRVLERSKDPRLAWIVTDAMRFTRDIEIIDLQVETLNKLLGVRLKRFNAWNDSVDHLIAWDIPAPPDYLEYKRKIYTRIFPAWKPLFVEGSIDWRYVTWGGVGIDDRPFGKTDERCNCIPAADNPRVTSASEAEWLADDAVIFGLSINGEQRAYPRQIMEVREMINDTLGGRDLGIPYCTLCGSAQAWYTDQQPEGIKRPVLRTSGLLARSNKVMFDLETYSVFDTFLGNALTGPLEKRKLQLKQASVVTTTWGAWKTQYPDTTVLAEYLALGNDFDFRNTRDANGPIFPIGNSDPRLPLQEDVLGVITNTGEPIAFHVPSVIATLNAGQEVKFDGVQVLLEAGGVRAVDEEGRDLGTHQAFWFAWSQFYPKTKLWPES